ncbi:MAG TPA: hypothetical protein VNY36_09640 [Bacteroidia bacterium]|jgi:hypothetical protein|nr:hypothetical protein [Bacteroidia bacterium]
MKHIKQSLVAILFLLSYVCLGQSNATKEIDNPYLNLKNDSVVIYDYDCGDPAARPIIEKGILSRSIKKRAKLDTSTVNVFNKMLGDTNSFGQMSSACFMPHLGMVYWYKGKPLAYISICMDCNVFDPNKTLKAQEHYWNDTYGGSWEGMSKVLRKFIKGFLVKYNFSLQPEESDPRDQ